ncbi:MAG: tetratricopeptide repeat protein [Verrucomicrobiales bacterium]|nr:tetratricopeptide repeat protein [Verrucomicrobiales bacterium]
MIVSSYKVIAIVGVAILSAICLMPEKSELMSRVIEDGDMTRALELIGEKPDAAAFHDLVTEFAETSSPGIFKEIKVLISLNDNLQSALETITSIDGILRDQQKHEICSLFAKRALELNQLTIAVNAYQWLSKSSPLKEKELQQAVTISRYARKPQSAINFINENLKQKKKDYRDLSRNERSLLIDLHREVNQGVEALTCLKEELQLAGSAPGKWDILDRVVTVATQCNRLDEVLPVLEQHLRETEAAGLTWQQVLDRQSKHNSDIYFLKFGKMIAQNYEWNSDMDKAFPYYHKLAVLGDAYSLERCFALYDWLQQREPMMALLAHVPLERLTCDQVIEYANLEASQANFSKAEELCSAALTRADVCHGDVYEKRGMMFLQQGKLSDALSDFKSAVKHQPENAVLLDQIGSIFASQGKHREALDTYRGVPLKNHSKLSFENYKLLAETLESEFDQLRIARYLLSTDEIQESSGVYIEVAQIFRKYVYDREAFESLAHGLEVFPESKKLKLAKIDLLLDNEAYNAAFEEIQQSFDSSDPRYLQRVLAVANSVEDSSPMLALLNLDDPFASSWNEGLRIDLAMLYEKMEKIENAVAIWESFDPDTIHLKRLNARVAYQKHHYREALALQEEYIKSTDSNDPYEWEFLGDVYLMTNRSADSQRAYTVAAQKFQQESTQRL